MPLALAAQIRSILEAALRADIAEESFRRRLVDVLAEYPNPLHPKSDLKPARTALGAFEASGGRGPAGSLAAVAVETLIVGCHVLDRLADRDRASTSADLQLAPALLFLTGKFLEQAQQATGALLDWSPVYENMVAACSGQQLDVDLQEHSAPELERAKRMTELKAGCFGSAIILAGAIAGQSSPQVRTELATLGLCIGASGQLIDDASDASLAAPTTSDLRLRKKTVPIAYFLNNRGDRPDWDALRDTLLAGRLSPENESRLREAVEESGAVAFTLALSNWYRIRAREILEGLQRRGCPTSLLEELLGPEQPTQCDAGPAQPAGSA